MATLNPRELERLKNYIDSWNKQRKEGKHEKDNCDYYDSGNAAGADRVRLCFFISLSSIYNFNLDYSQ